MSPEDVIESLEDYIDETDSQSIDCQTFLEGLSLHDAIWLS